jgi:hypothetical protein
MKSKGQSGQIAVSILLIMTVLVVISFSLATRTTNEVALTTQTTESAYVFNAAESGVNQALAQIYSNLEAGEEVVASGDEITTSENVTGTYSILPSSQIETRLMEGNSLTVELDPASVVDMDIDWAQEADCDDRASVIISVYSDSSGETSARHYPVGSGDGCGHDGDDFATPSDSSYDDYQYTYQLTGLTADDLFVRIKSIYNDTNLLVSGAGGDLPTQSYIAESRATNTAGDKKETRALRVVRTKAVAPAIMDYVVYTEGDLAK